MVKKRIAGAQMGQHLNEEVIILGSVTKKSSNANSIEIKATDGSLLNISLHSPFPENIGTYVEVHGTALSKSTMSCSALVTFTPEQSESVDEGQYNELMTICHVLGDKKWKISEDDDGC